MYFLDDSLYFPDPNSAHESGILAIGGDLQPERLLLAYQHGAFPWFHPEEPPVWWHPDPRFVIFPERIKISKSMRSYFNREKYTVTFDQNFTDVVKECGMAPRKEGDGTWISEEILDSFQILHTRGFAHSVEVWKDKELVGGLYGLSIGKVFFGESMFTKASNASKVALITLARILEEKEFFLIDCQIANSHLESMGGEYISREEFMNFMRKNTFVPTMNNCWSQMSEGINLKSILYDRGRL